MVAQTEKTVEKDDGLSVLEKICPRCRGAGGKEALAGSGWDICYSCLGAGHIATEFGNRIMELVRHQSNAVQAPH